ncbi:MULTISPECIES: hypothetical protein [Streptococcus]|uniref:Uncharacterized protein n=1 Tax=Streptococcus viridans TaxID=78535 RepID=A0A447Z6N8_9STRE|nr:MULTISPECIES: hypothetical protein [Streptococcus]VED68005.1 Uncharacterised protein [Streptococcus viridans]VEE19015.1 Uncharacterised protein [Streptococcus australis]
MTTEDKTPFGTQEENVSQEPFGTQEGQTVQEPFGAQGGQTVQEPFGAQNGQTAYEPFGAPGAQGFQQASPVEGPQAGGQEQYFQNQAPQVENNPFYQQGNPQAFQSQWNVQPKPKRGWTKFVVFSLLALLLGGLIGGGAGYFWGNSSKPQADANRTKRLERANEEAKKIKNSFITEKKETVFTWTLKDLATLSYTNKDGYGLTADQIVETYGLASSVEYDKNSLTLYWDRAKNAEHQNVYFRFEKVDGNYYLKTVEAYDLQEFYADEDDEDEDTSADRELSTKEFKNLKTGDKKTGEGGTSLSEILKKHKLSVVRIGTETKMTEDGEKYDSTRVIATVSFKVGDDYKTLRFVAQPDGDFLYIGPERY